MNNEESTDLLLTALRDLQSKQGESLRVNSDITVTHIDGHFVVLKFTSPFGGKFSVNYSAHGVVNRMSREVINDWANDLPYKPQGNNLSGLQ